jgi:hypothetical protein
MQRVLTVGEKLCRLVGFPTTVANARVLTQYVRSWQPNPYGYLFVTRNNRPPSSNNVVERRLWPILDTLKIPRCVLHAFRHTHSSLLVDIGAPVSAAQAPLGHSRLLPPRNPRKCLRINGLVSLGRGIQAHILHFSYYHVHGTSGPTMGGAEKERREAVDHFGSVLLPARRCSTPTLESVPACRSSIRNLCFPCAKR